MIKDIFNEIKEEAKTCEIKFPDGLIARMGFLINDFSNDNLVNLKINDENQFLDLLNMYVKECLKFYNLEYNYYNIKQIIVYMFSNITSSELDNLESYLLNRIKFLESNELENITGNKNTSIGILNYEIKKQSLMQETPYGFNSYFKENDSVYYLPRISFAISDDVCYIYAVQNKDTKLNVDPEYNLKVKNKFKTINSGVKEYRNVTPSFVISVSLFLSYLKENGITKLSIKTPLPLRQLNRVLSNEQRLKLRTNNNPLNIEDIEVFKKELEEKRLNDEFNSTVKFVNTFNRLKIHFDSVFIDQIDINRDIIMKVVDLSTKNEFLKEIVKINNLEDRSELDGKISKYSRG